ncbi:MAG: PLP-dependent aminotransferase family protein [Actinomycetota bacterium]
MVGASGSVPPVVSVDRSSAVPLHRQLYENLRAAILGGRLSAGTRLPSTREFAAVLGVSRNTVTNAYVQLLAERYLEGRVGSGTYVARSLPEESLRARLEPGGGDGWTGAGRVPSRRGSLLAATPTTTAGDIGSPRAFRPGVPALDRFPSGLWRRLTSEVWRRPPPGLLGYGDPAGYGPLRAEISAYLRAARAVRCSPEQVIVVSGSQQALDLAARVLLDPGDAAWVEEPGYVGARAALLGAGARLVPVPVDEEGLDVSAGARLGPDARLVHVTPSHQYPIGATMSLTRRLELLGWARRSGAWVLEDDYDSEYRYAGRPLEALQGLDAEGRVIYVGTFSKVLFPALRLGYLVLPPDLVDIFASARELTDRHPPGPDQAVLAEFIAGGHFERHLRRMRKLYADRQKALVEAADRHLAGRLEVRPAGAGMHLVGRLPEGTDDREVSRRAAALGVETSPVSAFASGACRTPGLVLGYAAFETAEIEEAAKKLRVAIDRSG